MIRGQIKDLIKAYLSVQFRLFVIKTNQQQHDNFLESQV